VRGEARAAALAEIRRRTRRAVTRRRNRVLEQRGIAPGGAGGGTGAGGGSAAGAGVAGP